MPRKGPAPRRPLVADPVYQSPLVTQLVNKVLVDGKRSVAEAIVYGAFDAIEGLQLRPRSLAETDQSLLVEVQARRPEEREIAVRIRQHPPPAQARAPQLEELAGRRGGAFVEIGTHGP